MFYRFAIKCVSVGVPVFNTQTSKTTRMCPGICSAACYTSGHVTLNDMCLSFTVCPETPTPNGPESQSGLEEDAADKDEEGSEDEWEQVGPRNKTSITRQADFVRTPITDIFGGHIRYVGGWIYFCPKGIVAFLLTFFLAEALCPASTTALQNSSVS